MTKTRSRSVLTLVATASLTALTVVALPSPGSAEEGIGLSPLASYDSGADFDSGGAEIPAYDAKSQRFFVTNGAASAVDVLELQDGELVRVAQIDVPAVTSVAVSPKGGLLAVAVPAEVSTDPGQVRTFNTRNLKARRTSTVGALPDALTFTPDGKDILVANEGEPSGYGPNAVDPEGSVSLVDAANGKVRHADFTSFNGQRAALVGQGVRIFGPGASVAQDLEPEFIAITGNGSTAYVALQENNALAVLDVASATITDILPLGLKDHAVVGNELDASNRDEGIDIRSWPVKGMYMPDGIDAYTAGGETFVVTANEGDGRDDDGFTDMARIGDDEITLDPRVFPNAEALQQDENLGRLQFAAATSPTNAAGEFTELHTFGARSFTIRDAAGTIVFDSGSDFEDITAEVLPEAFNSNNDDNDSFDARSDDKSPEPEGIEVGQIDDRTYAFIGLERVGGVMVYDITDPRKASFVDYVTTRVFDEPAGQGTGGDLAPEGLVFVSAEDSPTGEPLLAVSHEVSGTTTVFTLG